MAGRGQEIGERAYARSPISCPELARPGRAHTVPLAVSLRERAGVEGSGILSFREVLRNYVLSIKQAE
jgi:hypothetical protein